jgi:hypothetical protein
MEHQAARTLKLARSLFPNSGHSLSPQNRSLRANNDRRTKQEVVLVPNLGVNAGVAGEVASGLSTSCRFSKQALGRRLSRAFVALTNYESPRQAATLPNVFRAVPT